MSDHRDRVRHWVLYVAVILSFPACETAPRNTLAQDLAWERWQQCSGKYPTIRLKDIKSDGRVFVRGEPAEFFLYQECMRKAAAEQASKGKVAQSVVAAAPPAALQATEAPQWRRGYEWAFRWESPRGKGTFVWSVDRIDTVAGTEFYVVKSGRYEVYWRRSDFAIYMDKHLERGVEVRYTPPQARYAWPLTMGRSWEQTSNVERPTTRGTHGAITMSCAVSDSQERLAVPAGVFDTFRIECRNKRTARLMFRHWYSPEVKNIVKEESVFDYGVRERELIAFRIPRGKSIASVIPDAATGIGKGDTAQALRKGAGAGDAHAMAMLGFMYFTGRGGLPKDDAEAVAWFRRGADAGDSLAMAFLGASHWAGLGTLPRDQAEAVRWFRRGAAAGDGRAMAMLGQTYLTGGGGLERDEAEAVGWFRKGADAGDARAMAMLGEMYLTGEGGLAKDEATAVRWIRRAADAGDGFAMATLGSMHETGEGGLAKDDAEAVRWYRRGAEVGSGRAMTGLGSMYSTGRGGLAKNEAEAVRWYREGANVLDAVAMFQLARAYESGRGIARDPEEAARWYEKSASFGFSEAFDRLPALGEQP